MKKIAILCLLAILSVQAYAQTTIEDEIFIHDGSSLRYKRLKPTDRLKKYPLVILLHGVESRGSDNQKPYNSFEKLIKKFTGDYSARLIIPQCPDTEYWSSGMTPKLDSKGKPTGTYIYDTSKGYAPTQSMKSLMALIQSEINTGEIDTDRVYVVGVSMGGFGTYELLWRMPVGTFKAAVPICGATDVAMDKLQHFGTHTAMWLFHGKLDKIVEVSNSRSFRRVVQRIPESFVKYTEYADLGHQIWNTVFANTELLPWLFGRREQIIGYYKISSPDKGETLTKTDNNLTLESFKTLNTQSWFLTRAGSNSYYLYITDASKKYLSSKGGILSFVLTTDQTNKTEYWKLTKTKNNTYLIESEGTGQRLVLSGNNLYLTSNHTDTNGQEWDITPSKLFVLGGATTAKWDITKSFEMVPDTLRNGVFTWTGMLGASDFKFITSRLSGRYASYNALEPNTPAAGTIHKLATDPGTLYNDKFKASKAGVYKLTVDLVNKTFETHIIDKPEHIYMIGTALGTATTSGYDGTKAPELQPTDSNGSVFEWGGYLKTGDLKYILNRFSYNASLNPTAAANITTKTTTYKLRYTDAETNNYKFTVKTAGYYHMRVNVMTMTAEITYGMPNTLRSSSNNIENHILQTTEEDMFRIYAQDRQIEITSVGKESTAEQINVYNIAGKIISKRSNEKLPCVINGNLYPGVYIVEVIYNGKAIRSKVLIR